jgi:protein gp37
MSRTAIEWTDRSLNPGVYGCAKVSPACRNCYAMGMAHRLGPMGQSAYDGVTDERGEWTGEVRVDYSAIEPAFAKLPKRKPCRVFVTSMSDLFHADVPFEFIRQVFSQMRRRPHLTFQVLTKRPARMVEFWEWLMGYATGDGKVWPDNVWAGTTVEDQKRANERIPLLVQVPAKVRFLSVEPMLGPIDLTWLWHGYTDDGPAPGVEHCSWCGGASNQGPHDCYSEDPLIHWVIAGGESGRGARPSHPDWFRGLRDQCDDAVVPFFFKQWGAHVHTADTSAWTDCKKPVHAYPQVNCGDGVAMRVGKKAAGRVLDGRTWDELPR